ncbi:MAG TPA: MBG domain-containing protein [Dongiaceae bacterium]|nr:MBG domain-containing protein [Dongiaceae bacterium]
MKSKTLHSWNRLAGAALLALAATLPAPHAAGGAALDMDDAAAIYGIALDKDGNYYSGTYGLELWVLNGTSVPASINSVTNVTAYGDLAAAGFTLAQTWSGQTMRDGTFELGGVALPMVQPPGSEAVLALAAWTGGAANWAAAVAAGAQGGVIAFANATVNGSLLPPPAPPDLEQGWNAYGQDLVMTPAGSLPNTPPALTWNKPASIIYGTPLSSVQLNATANVPGSKVYTPPAGTVLPVGTNILSLVFSAAGYSSVTTNVSLVVLPAPLTVAANNATRLCGAANPAFTDTLSGLVNGDNITAANTCSATTASPAGTYPIIPGLVDPSHRAANYTVSLVNGTLTVLSAAPPSGDAALDMDDAAATYGIALDKDGNYYSGAYGLELWVLNGTAVPASINSVTNVTAYGDLAADGFTLAQTWSGQTMRDGTFELGGVALPMVQPPGSEAVLALAAWTGGAANWAAAVAAGAQGGVIAFANATVNGSLLPPPVPPDLEQGWNAYGQDLVMTPTGSLPNTPLALTWDNPASIIYGTVLSSVQLNATANVPGSKVYSPPAGTVLAAGTNILSLVFSAAGYSSVTTNVSLVVLPAPLTVTAKNASRPYGQTNPVFTDTITGLVNGDNITAATTCSATPTSPPGSYPIVPTLVSPNHLQTNYHFTLVDGTLTVLPVMGPPGLAALADRTVYAGTLLSFWASATETDQPPRTLTFSLGPGAPAGASIGRGSGPSPLSGLFAWTPTAAQAPSTNRITVIVSDNGVPPLSASASFTVVVKPVPTPPVLAALADRTVYAGSLLSFRASATETDQPPRTLTFSLGPGAPAGASIGRGSGPSPLSGLFAWTPTAAQAPSTNRITVIVSDNGVPPLSASASFTVVVKPAPTPPVLGDLDDRIVYAGSLLSFRASATENDQPPRTLTFSLGPDAPAGASIGRGTGPSPVSSLFTWTPTAAQAPSANRITVIVTDNGVPPLSASNSFTVVVLVPKRGLGEGHHPRSLPSVTQRGAVAHDPQARILSVSEPNAGQCTIRFSGVNGQAYELQASSDLETWRAVTSGVFPSTEIEVVDTIGAQAGCFYRIRLLNPGP